MMLEFVSGRSQVLDFLHWRVLHFTTLWLRPKSNEAKRSFSHSQVVSACRCSYDIGPRWTVLDSVQTERWLHSVQIYHARQQVQVMSCEACVEHRKHKKSQSNKFNKRMKALLQLKRSGRNPKGCVVYRCIYVLKVLIWLDGVWQVLALTFPVWQKHLQHLRQIGIRWVEESIEEGSTVNHRCIDLVAVFFISVARVVLPKRGRVPRIHPESVWDAKCQGIGDFSIVQSGWGRSQVILFLVGSKRQIFVLQLQSIEIIMLWNLYNAERWIWKSLICSNLIQVADNEVPHLELEIQSLRTVFKKSVLL